MNSVLEKITLYDFFGYFIPGITCITLIFIYPFCICDIEIIKYLKYNEILGVWLLLGFINGILISEISRIIYSKIFKINKNCYWQFICDSLEYSSLAVQNALINSHLYNDENNHMETDRLIAKYFCKMYGNIQIDEAYKRIHNYASCETMYKNMSLAVLLGTLPIIVWGITNLILKYCVLMMVLWLGISLVFAHRFYRFRVKKDTYAIIWFMQKYS